MSKELISELLETTLASGWSTTPIAWANVEARDQAISGAPLLSEGSKNYIEFEVDVTKASPFEVPTGLVRYSGYITIKVNVREGTGTRGMDALIDSLNDLFHLKLLYDGVTCIRTHEYLDSGRYVIQEGWATHQCQWPFTTEFRLTA